MKVDYLSNNEEFEGNVVEEVTPNESTYEFTYLDIAFFLFILVLISLLVKIMWSG